MKDYVTNVFNHNDGRMEHIFQFCEPFMREGDVYKSIEEMNITLPTLASSLQKIADVVFTSRKANNKPYHVAALFMYCIKMDEYFKVDQKDYTSDLIVDALVNILIGVNYNIPKVYCSIL